MCISSCHRILYVGASPHSMTAYKYCKLTMWGPCTTLTMSREVMEFCKEREPIRATTHSIDFSRSLFKMIQCLFWQIETKQLLPACSQEPQLWSSSVEWHAVARSPPCHTESAPWRLPSPAEQLLQLSVGYSVYVGVNNYVRVFRKCVCVHSCMYACTHVCVCDVCVHVWVWVCVCVGVCMCMCVLVCTCDNLIPFLQHKPHTHNKRKRERLTPAARDLPVDSDQRYPLHCSSPDITEGLVVSPSAWWREIWERSAYNLSSIT